jgi:hypothetical protein
VLAICILKFELPSQREFLEVIAINGRIKLKCIFLRNSFGIFGLHLFGCELGPVMDCSKRQ